MTLNVRKIIAAAELGRKVFQVPRVPGGMPALRTAVQWLQAETVRMVKLSLLVNHSS